MNIVYALDDGYKLYTAVSIYSLLSNKNKESEYKIHILHHPDLDIRYFDKLQEHFNIKFNFVDMGDTAKDLFIDPHIKTPAYYRLYICKVLPDLDRCIYLDGDTIILKDLTELYNTDLGNNIIGGILDVTIGFGEHMNEAFKNKKRPTNYINSGILLIDLVKLRNPSIDKLIKEYIKFGDYTLDHDQNIINFTLENQIFILPFKYNMQNMPYLTSVNPHSIECVEYLSKINNNYNKRKFVLDLIEPVIIHYIVKPLDCRDYRNSNSKIIRSNIWFYQYNNYLMSLNNKTEEYVICSPAKFEKNYILEWVNYHIKLGFDHIYIYNNDDDQNIIKEILKDNKKVTIINYQYKKNFKKELLIDFYTNGYFKWCAFIDCDEFITLNGYSNIKDYINSFPDDCNAISLNWLCYGSNGNNTFKKAPIQKRMEFCGVPINWDNPFVKHPQNEFVKTIYKKYYNNTALNPNAHCMVIGDVYLNNGTKITKQVINYVAPMNLDVAYIKHYYVRDFDHFIFNKCKELRDDGLQDRGYDERIICSIPLENPRLPSELLKLANIQVKNTDKFIGKKILCKNIEKLVPLLKKDLNILYCGDLKNNNILINIANYNKCYYSWVLPDLFDNVYKEIDFDLIIE